MKKVAVVYVPGLGDSNRTYDKIVPYWKLYGLEVEIHRMNWEDGKSFPLKLNGLVNHVNKLLGEQKRVVLLGVSAGGSAALNAYNRLRDKVVCAVNVSGFLRSSDSAFAAAAKRSPALAQSVQVFEIALPNLSASDRRRILVMHPILDGAVPPESTLLKGSRTILMPSIGHVFSIFVALFFYPIAIKRFIKSEL